jgi:hypothetical protein
VPERTRQELRDIARTLDDALCMYWANRGIRVGNGSNWAWDKFFEEADSDGNRMLNFWELEQQLTSKLQKLHTRDLSDGSKFDKKSTKGGGWQKAVVANPTTSGVPESLPSTVKTIIKGVTRDDLYALWETVDADHSGEVSCEEWHLSLYRLRLEAWPDAKLEDLVSVVEKMSAAADKWHRAGSNWYKVFNLVDKDQSGGIGFNEMFDIIRRPLPCLAIPATVISDSELKSLWKSMDEDRSGEITVREFMVFMRRLEAKSGKRRTPRPAEGSVVAKARMMKHIADAARPKMLTDDQAQFYADALREKSEEDFAAAYADWGLEWTGSVSEWHWIEVTRNLLGIHEDLLDDDTVHRAYSFLAGDACQVPIQTLLELGT